jgi:DNA-binding beta-propeller fold protein YncE
MGLLAIGFMVLNGAGCSPALRPIFEPQDTAPVWPGPPAAPRIRYLGELAAAADLKPPRRLFQGIGDLLLGPAKPSPLYGPRAVVCTPDGGRVWVGDAGGRCLHLLDLETRAYKKIERVGGVPLLAPVGLCLGPEGSIFVCDSEAPALYRISDRDGALRQTVRLPEDVLRPVAASWDEAAGELYVVDIKAHDLKVLGLDGALRRILGRRGNGPGEFNFPSDVADDGRTLWIVDTGNARLQGLRRTGEAEFEIGRVGDGPGNLALPKAVALDSEGQLYVVDARFENVQIFDRQGELLLFFGEEGTGPGRFWLPADIFIDRQDRIWVCDTYNGRLQVFEYVRQREANAAKE